MVKKLNMFLIISQILQTVFQKKQYDLFDLIETTFPMGSMTGAPKISAMKHIDRIELEGRGSYSGSIGYITPTGDFDFNVLIRSLFHNSETEALVANVGGAITSLSDAHQEYEECMLKAEAVVKAVSNE